MALKFSGSFYHYYFLANFDVLYRKCGTLYIEKNPGFRLDEVSKSSGALGYTHQRFSNLSEHFPSFRHFDGYCGLLDPEGGLLRADNCCRVLAEKFIELGGVIVENTAVSSIEPGKKVSVFCHNGKSFTGDNLVLAAGPWSNILCKMIGLDLPLKVSSLYKRHCFGK